MSAMQEVDGVEGTRFLSIAIVRETGSTNRDLLEAASQGAPEGRVLITDHQTAGRGRQGRIWLDDPGSSLLCSVLLRPPTQWAPFVPMATGLAIVDAVKGWGIDLGLKWPNDVLADVTRPGVGAELERKVCGILAEAVTSGRASGPGSDMAVVVGFGFNLAWSDANRLGPEVAARGIDLAGLLSLEGREADTPSRLDLARAVLASLERQLVMLDTRGAGDLLDRYRSVCLTLGRRVRFETPSGVIEGRAVDVAADGGLVIDVADAGDDDAGPGPRQGDPGHSDQGVHRVVVHAGDAHHV